MPVRRAMESFTDEYFDLLTRVREAGDWEAWPAFFAPYLSKTTLISPPTVDAALKALQDERIIREITGRKRRRLYASVKYLDIMSKGTEIREYAVLGGCGFEIDGFPRRDDNTKIGEA